VQELTVCQTFTIVSHFWWVKFNVLIGVLRAWEQTNMHGMDVDRLQSSLPWPELIACFTKRAPLITLGFRNARVDACFISGFVSPKLYFEIRLNRHDGAWYTQTSTQKRHQWIIDFHPWISSRPPLRVLFTPFNRMVIFHQEPHIPPYYQFLATRLWSRVVATMLSNPAWNDGLAV
jgi:hypothetical protein